MRLRYASLIGLVLTAGRGASCTKAAESVLVTDHERACCGAYIDQDSEMVHTSGDGRSMMPMVCVQHRVGCPALGVQAPVETSAFDKAIQHQVDLRSRPSCDKSEWEGRCPSGSTMLLANSRGGCVAAGCTPLGGAEATVVVEEKEGDVEGLAILRAVVAQEVNRLREATTGPMPTMYKHSSHLRKQFVKDQKALLKKLKAATTSRPDVDELRLLLEKADLNGFRATNIDAARRVVQAHHLEQRGLPVLSARLAETTTTSVAADVEEGMAACQADLHGVRHQLIDLQNSSTTLEERARIAEGYGKDLKEELTFCLASIEDKETKTTAADGSLDPPSCDCGGDDGRGGSVNLGSDGAGSTKDRTTVYEDDVGGGAGKHDEADRQASTAASESH